MITKTFKLSLFLSLLLYSNVNIGNAATDPDCIGMYNNCMAGMLYGENPDCQAYGAPGTLPVTDCTTSDNSGAQWSVSCGKGCTAYPGCSVAACTPPPSPKHKRG